MADTDRGPQRDRHLAAQPRLGPRRASEVGSLVRSWMRGPEGQRIRRNRHIHTALEAVLSPAELPLVVAVSAVKGTLTLEIADHLLLAELRTIRHRRLLGALAEAGTGLSRIRYRLKRA